MSDARTRVHDILGRNGYGKIEPSHDQTKNRKRKSPRKHHEMVQAEAKGAASNSRLDRKPRASGGALTAKTRSALNSKDFVFPAERKYPIEDKNHARNALARVSQHGSSEQKAKVRAAVHNKYPTIGQKKPA